MTFGDALRRHWQEAVLTLVLSLPWLTLLAFGIIWLWQAGHVLAWALACAALGLLAWPLRHAVKRRADAAAGVRHHLALLRILRCANTKSHFRL